MAPICRALTFISIALTIPYALSANFSIAGFFGVTSQDPTDPKRCAADIDHYKGVVFYEAFSYALQLVNNQSITYDGELYLYGQTISPYGYDTCQSSAIALGRVRAGITQQFRNRGIGMIGPLTTAEAAVMGPILFLYNMPAVSYYADGINLDNRLMYPSLYRTVPSSRFLFEAILDLIQEFGWKYVTVVTSRGDEGLERATYFEKMALKREICVSRMVKLPVVPSGLWYKNAVDAIRENDKLTVVILFTTTLDTDNLLMTAKAMGVHPGDYTFIGDFDWNVNRYLNPVVKDMFHGSLIVGYRIRKNYDFWEYLVTRKADASSYPFFRQFWYEVFGCVVKPFPGYANCTGNESLSMLRPLEGHVPVHLVMEAVFTLTCGFRHYLQELCPYRVNRTECLGNETMRGGKLSGDHIWLGVQKHLQRGNQLKCPMHDSVKFDSFGAGPAHYVIYNVRSKNNNMNLVEVGNWSKDLTSNSTINYVKKFHLSKASITWMNNSIHPPQSLCSVSCGPGEISFTDASTTNPVCCFKCRKCDPNSVVVNNTCIVCDSKTEIADIPAGKCRLLPLIEIDPGSVLSIVVILFAVLGAVFTTIPTIIFIYYKDTRFVKASGRELCYVMFAGIYAGFLFPLVFLAPPSNAVCKIQYLASGVSLTIFYAPLVLKLNRVYRIFESARSKIKRPPLTSPLSQVMMCIGIIGIQGLVAVSFMVSNGDTLQHVLNPRNDIIVVTCRFDMFMLAVNLTISLVLIMMCTFYAFKTRNFPANYNESKSIGATMYVTCILWAIFITAYFFTTDTNGKFTSSYMTVIFASVICYITLFGIFGPKIVFITKRIRAREEIDCKPTMNTFVSSTVPSSVDLSKTVRINYEENTKLTRDVGTETDDLFSLNWL